MSAAMSPASDEAICRYGSRPAGAQDPGHHRSRPARGRAARRARRRGDTIAWDQALRESHQEGITLVGAEVGSPIIAVPGPDPADAKIAFFGPA
jgi:hypothetical protein